MTNLHDPVFDTVLKAIKDSTLDCCMWSDKIQRELAIEIMQALENSFTIKLEPKP